MNVSSAGIPVKINTLDAVMMEHALSPLRTCATAVPTGTKIKRYGSVLSVIQIETVICVGINPTIIFAINAQRLNLANAVMKN